jgi:hypothetical protein
MIGELLEKAGASGTVQHEYASREFYNAFARFKEADDHAWTDEVNALIDICPHAYIAGNGYAHILPMFAERCGPNLVVIHLRRTDREAAIKSLTKNCELFPFAYANYQQNPDDPVKRFTAPHFGEMSALSWQQLPLWEKLAWYYDKTHSLIQEHRVRFTRHVEIDTERL